jgi:hypothetical protein
VVDWKLYIDSPQKRVLDLCGGSLDDGGGWGYGGGNGYGGGYGDGYGDGDGNGDRYSWRNGSGGFGDGDGRSSNKW